MREMVAINVSVLKNKLGVTNISAVQHPTNIPGCMVLFEGRIVVRITEILFLFEARSSNMRWPREFRWI